MRPQTPRPDHPTFGASLVRCYRPGFRLLLGGLLTLVGIVFITMAVIPFVGPTAFGANPSTEMLIFLCAFALIFITMGALLIAEAFVAVEFFELGVVKTRFRRETSIPYADARQCVLNIKRVIVHGVPAISTTFWLSDSRRRRVVDTSPESLTGAGALADAYGFKSNDDGLPEHVLRHMALAFAHRILAGEAIRWNDPCEITPDGLRMIHGRRKGQIVPFHACDFHDFRDGRMYLYALGEKKHLMWIRLCTPNFWPCFLAFTHLAGWPDPLRPNAAANNAH